MGEADILGDTLKETPYIYVFSTVNNVADTCACTISIRRTI
jgi:hypothetical protein